MSEHTFFWEWFENHEDELFAFERNQEAIFDKLSAEIQKVDPDLSFEIGPKLNDLREFVVSASGIKRAFPAVQTLVANAPRFSRWRITAFRPRRSVLNEIEVGGERISPQDVEFSLLHNGRNVGIYLFIPGYSEDDTELRQIGYLLLDEALGEFDVESKLGMIKMLSPEKTTSNVRYPLCELASRFDALHSILNSTHKPPHE